jgi:hypothetical protein
MTPDRNRQTPAIAACSKAQLAHGCSSSSMCCALGSGTGLAPVAALNANRISSAVGTASATLPTIATTWVRTVRTIRSARRAALAGVPSSWSSRAASSAAVIAGCLVATVKCSRWISAKPRP